MLAESSSDLLFNKSNEARKHCDAMKSFETDGCQAARVVIAAGTVLPFPVARFLTRTTLK